MMFIGNDENECDFLSDIDMFNEHSNKSYTGYLYMSNDLYNRYIHQEKLHNVVIPDEGTVVTEVLLNSQLLELFGLTSKSR